MGHQDQACSNIVASAGRSSVNHTTRRDFLKDAALAGAALSTSTLAPGSLFAATQAQTSAATMRSTPSSVPLSLLGNGPLTMSTGVSWGVPWAQGAIARGSNFNLGAQGSSLPLQSWPLAYWPDGSIKWTGLATVLPVGFQGPSHSPLAQPLPPPVLSASRRTVNRSPWIPVRSSALSLSAARTSSTR